METRYTILSPSPRLKCVMCSVHKSVLCLHIAVYIGNVRLRDHTEGFFMARQEKHQRQKAQHNNWHTLNGLQPLIMFIIIIDTVTSVSFLLWNVKNGFLFVYISSIYYLWRHHVAPPFYFQTANHNAPALHNTAQHRQMFPLFVCLFDVNMF